MNFHPQKALRIASNAVREQLSSMAISKVLMATQRTSSNMNENRSLSKLSSRWHAEVADESAEIAQPRSALAIRC